MISGFIISLLFFLIFIFSFPMLHSIFSSVIGANSLGSATNFVINIFLWFIFIIFIAGFLNLFSSGGNFLSKGK
jgi:hypothetical protein